MTQPEEQRSRRLGRGAKKETASQPGAVPAARSGDTRSTEARGQDLRSSDGRGQDPRGQHPRGQDGSATTSGARGKLSWIAAAVAAVLTAWQIIYAITLQNVAETSQDVYTSVWLFVSLILAVGCAVLGIVAVSQRALPRWPAIAALSIGVYVFLVCVASWIGGLMAAPM